MPHPEPSPQFSSAPPPKVSVVVAARNEEAILDRLFASLAALDYPKDRLEVILGDDGSTDGTHAVMQAWKDRLPGCRIFPIHGTIPGLTGKGNVLAQLCQEAQGEVFLFTDADCSVPPGWALAMAEPFRRDTDLGILTGVTIPKQDTAFAMLQAVDWTAAQFAIWSMALVRIPITAMGNNMAISARAYRESGGFEATAGGITEDYAIFHHIVGHGFGWAHRFNPRILARTLPMPDREAWLEQRVRWFSGAMKLPWSAQLPFWFQMFFYPALLVLMPFIGWQWVCTLIAMKVIWQSVMYAGGLLLLGQYRLLPLVLVYEPWSVWACWALWLRWRRSSVITWKGRAFAKAEA